MDYLGWQLYNVHSRCSDLVLDRICCSKGFLLKFYVGDLEKTVENLNNRASFRESAALHCSRLSTVGHRRGARAVACLYLYIFTFVFVHICTFVILFIVLNKIYCNYICNSMYLDVVKCASSIIFKPV